MEAATMPGSSTAELNPELADAVTDAANITPPDGLADSSSSSQEQPSAATDEDWSEFQRLQQEEQKTSEEAQPTATDDRGQEVTDESDQPDQPQEQSQASQEPPEGFDQALDYYLSQGMTDDMVKGMWNADPEGFINQGLQAVQNEQDQMEAQPAEQEQVEPEAAPAVDLDKQVKDVLETLKEDDLYAELSEPLEQLTTAVAGQFQQMVQEQASELDRMRGLVVDLQLDQVINELAETYPQVTTPQGRERFLGGYDTMIDSGRFTDIRTAGHETAKWIFGGQNTDQIKTQMLNQTTAQRNGRPRVMGAGMPSPTGSRTAQTTTEKEFEWFAQARKDHLG